MITILCIFCREGFNSVKVVEILIIRTTWRKFLNDSLIDLNHVTGMQECMKFSPIT